MITLHWVQTALYKLKTFVANRVAQIQDTIKYGKLRHVPSHSNPTDALSRGQFPNEFLHNSIWSIGPSWLAEDENNWPSTFLPVLDIPERRAIIVMSSVHTWDRNILSRFSSFNKMKRVILYCLRFTDYCRSRKSFVGDLSVEDLKRAEVRILRLIQLVSFHNA